MIHYQYTLSYRYIKIHQALLIIFCLLSPSTIMSFFAYPPLIFPCLRYKSPTGTVRIRVVKETVCKSSLKLFSCCICSLFGSNTTITMLRKHCLKINYVQVSLIVVFVEAPMGIITSFMIGTRRAVTTIITSFPIRTREATTTIIPAFQFKTNRVIPTIRINMAKIVTRTMGY